ncbi:MAG TPA: hypothetical protein VHW00_19420 [Thermoanaerobaculia bacterium]|nr:hypothetical protein [Thermoanaerobaculia bacterium]
MADEKKPDEKRIASSATINAPDEATHKRVLAAATGGAQFPAPPTPDPRWGVEHCCVREFWAVVERDGTVVRGRNVVRGEKIGTGIYQIFFTGEVADGVFVATIGRPGIATEPPGEITLAVRCCPGFDIWQPFTDNKGVWVQTFDSTGKPSDRAFHLIVMTQ